MRKPTKFLSVLLASAALVAVGCGSDDKSSDQGDTGKAAVPTGNAVGMKDLKFDPVELDVPAGDTVTWTNDESIPHNVVATKGAKFKSDEFGEGGTYKFKTSDPGTIEYTCTLHPGMDGTLNVK